MALRLEIDGGKIKPAGYKQEYTLDQIKELKKCKDDIFYFIEKYVKIIHPLHGSVPFKLFDYQRRLIQCYLDKRKVICLAPRQSGKSQTSSAFILWWAIFQEDQNVLIISKTGDGAKEIMERIWYSYEELPWFLKPGVETDAVHTKNFDNGSKIEALNTTANTGRGKSISLLYFDEAAYIQSNIEAKLWTSLNPVISTGGKCILTSTPNTDEDKFSKIWFSSQLYELSDPWVNKKPKKDTETKIETIFETEEVEYFYNNDVSIIETNNDISEEDKVEPFYGFHVAWNSVPYKNGFRDEKFKREQFAAGYNLADWEREFCCLFVSGDPTLISPMAINSLNQHIQEPLFIDKYNCRWYEDILPNTAYSVVLDPSEGIDADNACIQVWEIPYLKQVAEWHSNQADEQEQAKMLFRILKRIDMMQHDFPEHKENNIYYSVEKNGLGKGVLTAILYEGEEKYPGWLIDSENNQSRGLVTTLSSKKQACIEFKSMVERGLFLPRSKYLLSEIKTFCRAGRTYKAKSGKKDDIVMSCVLMCHLISEIRKHEPDLDDRVRIDIIEYDNENDNPENIPFTIFV